ncbi:MAG: 2-dehydropantoate 2-reductase [Gammaproteobacteria bacterium]
MGNLEILIEALGKTRVLGGLSYHSGALRGPGHASHTHAGPTWLGELDGSRSARVAQLHEMLAAAGFKPETVDNIIGYIWSKFIHNCAINPICAATGLRVGELARVPAADALQTKIIEEALAIIRAKNIAITEPDPLPTIKAFCKIKFNKPSMLQHMEAGKRTEIDALNGAIVREGRALGIPTPYNEALSWIIKAMETSRIQLLHGEPIDYEALERKMKSANPS